MARLRTIATADEAEEPASVFAWLIGPLDRTMRLVEIATLPARSEPPKHGPQLNSAAVTELLGTKEIAQHTLIEEQALLTPVRESAHSWRLGDSEPLYGPGLIVGYRFDGDSYVSSAFSLARLQELVRFGEADAPAGEDEEEAHEAA